MHLSLLGYSFEFLIKSTPRVSQSNKLDLFTSYFRSTWFERFKPDLWNTYETTGPRSNNHLEGYNFKLIKFVDCIHPNIYSLVNSCKVYRRPIYVKKDEMLFNLKVMFFYKYISLETYLSFIAKLFKYDKTVEFNETSVDFYGFLVIEHPVDAEKTEK